MPWGIAVLPYGKGGKSKYARDIAHTIRATEQQQGKSSSRRSYWEPFMGMFSVGLAYLAMVEREGKQVRSLAGTDVDKDVVVFWKAVARGWLAPDRPLTQSQWDRTRKQPASPRRTYYGLALGFGGHMFDTAKPRFATNRAFSLKARAARVREAGRLLRIVPMQQPSQITLGDSTMATPPRNSTIYCDPPYVGARDHNWDAAAQDRLWVAMARWLQPATNGNLVFLSAMGSDDARLRRGAARYGLSLQLLWHRKHNGDSNQPGVQPDGRLECLYRVT